MRKTNFTFLLVILLSMVGTNAFAHDLAAQNADGVTIYYTFHESSVGVTYPNNNIYSAAYSGNVVIPESVIYKGNEYPVTSIDDNAFYGCWDLRSVVIPNSVTNIGSRAFIFCDRLSQVSVPQSVVHVGIDAFKNTPWYQEFPEGIIYIGSVAYSYKGNLGENVVIKDGTLTISAYAFKNCKGISTIRIPTSLNRIESEAFSGCYGLKKVIVSDIAAWCNIEYYRATFVSSSYSNEANPLYYAQHLYSDENTEITELEIPEGIKEVGPTAFINCNAISSVKFPSTLQSIGSLAFFGCSSLSSLFFPNNITSIGVRAFPVNTKLYVNKKNTATLPAMWQSGYKPYLAGTSNILEPPYLSVATTQTTATFKLENKYDEFNYSYYTYNFGKVAGLFIGNEVTLTGLFPEISEHFNVYIALDNQEQILYTIQVPYTTQAISPSINPNATASSLHVTTSYIEGDAKVASQRLVLNPSSVMSGKIYGGTDLEELRFDVMGLAPNSHVASLAYQIVVSNGVRSQYYTTRIIDAKTEALTLKTKQPKVVSLGNVIVSAEANIDDEEKNVGFEWRRTDWTDDFESNTGTANMVEGTMEGYIRNLNTEKLWKFRPYYLADNGTYYYGDWVGLDPTNISFFEPTVHTYDKIVVNGNTALVKGYALGGSDDVTVQGFKYWKSAGGGSNRATSTDIPNNAKTIEASGTVMEVSLPGLDYDSSYSYVAFATTSKGTYYGDIKTFETGNDPTGINTIKMDNASTEDVHEVARFNMQGRRIATPEKGINIIKMSDGTTRKILVK